MGMQTTTVRSLSAAAEKTAERMSGPNSAPRTANNSASESVPAFSSRHPAPPEPLGLLPALAQIPIASPELSTASAEIEQRSSQRLPPLPLQRKLAIGSANDPLEHEADRVADQVLRIPDLAPVGTSAAGANTLQRKCSCGDSGNGTCEECKEKKLQRSATASATTAFAPPIVHDVLRSPGQPLDAATRKFFEPRFGHDFGAVRLHTDDRAAKSASAISAAAYAVGNSIVFGHNRFPQEIPQNRELLAHELAHVVQQAENSSVSTRIRRQAESAAGTQVSAPPAFHDSDAANARSNKASPDAPRARDIDEVDYAFVFAGGAYGKAAENFIRRYYPKHRLIESASLESMFDRIYSDTRQPAKGHSFHVEEIVIVTHANAAGGMKIPLTRDDVAKHRFFNVWDVEKLQEEFQHGLHQRFRRRRHELAGTVMDDRTTIVVRGCEFGQSQEALDVLRSLFGGEPMVWAPKAYQGYENIPIGSSLLRTPEEAYDFLIKQEFLPPELAPAPDEDKRKYIARVFGLHGSVPAEFFVVGPEAHAQLAGLIKEHRGITAEAEGVKVRDSVANPSGNDLWGESSPSLLGSDAEFDRLTMPEIARRAHDLMKDYQPQNGCLIQRLRRTWERKELDDRYWNDYVMSDTSDPLAGLPDATGSFFTYMANRFRDNPATNPYNDLPIENVFGDSNLIAGDASRFPCRTPHDDTFETKKLDYKLPDSTQGARTGEYSEPLAVDDTHPANAPAASATKDKDAATLEAYRRAHDFTKSGDIVPPPPDLTNMSEADLGAEYVKALADTKHPGRLADVETEIDRRIEDPEHPGFGLALPRDIAPGNPANAGVTPDIALQILENVSRGDPPFKPELGRVGGVSWFVTEGNPFVGRTTGPRVNIDVELTGQQGGLVFKEADLKAIFDRESASSAAELEADFRRRLGIDDSVKFTRNMRNNFGRFQRTAVEARMWVRVGEQVKASPTGTGEVILQDSVFSRSGNGRFGVVADASKIRLKGGVAHLLETLEAHGVVPDPTATSVATEVATHERWAGRVRGAFRYGGKILIVVALANDAYRIITARDKTRTVISVAGGWAGATAAGAAFAELWTPADAAGPWAWLVHGVGSLLAGGIGYFVGSETTTYVYDLAIDSDSEERSVP